MAFTTPRAVAQQSAFLTNGLVAYYSFNDSSRDFSGNKNDAKLMEGTSYDFGRFGADRCVKINGKPGLNSGVSCDNKFGSSLFPVGRGGLTSGG